MQAYKIWNKLFSEKHIKEHYYEKVHSKTSVGLDKITTRKFESELDDSIRIILRKTGNQSYKFTRYKQLLFLKGTNKPPRCVSVPTVRDKLTLSVLNEVIVKVFGEGCHARLPQLIVQEISDAIGNYDSFIKLDIASFYSNINQEILMSILRSRIRKTEILSLIESAIETESLPYPIKEKVKRGKKTKGIPEGLPISNALANIYLSQFDLKFISMSNIKYWRYVDDILILVNKNDLEKTERIANEEIAKLGLEFNSKKDRGSVVKGFEYLGYKIDRLSISVRNSSILKFEQAIEDLVRTINKENDKFIEWKLNNKITGFVWNDNKYGWVFFYSQIQDMKLLFHMDNLLLKILRRYNLDGRIKPKRFIRTYFEITKALHTTNYIPNFDKYTIEDKKNVLHSIYGDKALKWNDEEIESKFRYIMSKEIRDIEKDIEHFS